jgi:circadian clock protein KaiB
MKAQRGKLQKTINGSAMVVLRLYVADNAPNSAQAVANLEAICQEYLNGSHDLEIIDVLEHPQRAMAAGILVTPTLSKLYPLPTAQVVGNLNDKSKVLLAIGIRSPAT